jgi:type IV pilus assembly protein PilA
MRNNKGFSLVELIIVIAIMAILVGVMAPQLIKYIEKTNVSSDTQLCDSVKTAITTAMMDPAVIADTGAKIPTNDVMKDVKGNLGGGSFEKAVEEILGVQDTDLDKQIKSTCNGGKGSVEFCIAGANSVHVQVKGSDSTGNKGKGNDKWTKPIYVD